MARCRHALDLPVLLQLSLARYAAQLVGCSCLELFLHGDHSLLASVTDRQNCLPLLDFLLGAVYLLAGLDGVGIALGLRIAGVGLLNHDLDGLASLPAFRGLGLALRVEFCSGPELDPGGRLLVVLRQEFGLLGFFADEISLAVRCQASWISLHFSGLHGLLLRQRLGIGSVGFGIGSVSDGELGTLLGFRLSIGCGGTGCGGLATLGGCRHHGEALLLGATASLADDSGFLANPLGALVGPVGRQPDRSGGILESLCEAEADEVTSRDLTGLLEGNQSLLGAGIANLGELHDRGQHLLVLVAHDFCCTHKRPFGPGLLLWGADEGTS